MTPSKRSQVDPFVVMDVLDRANSLARAGRTVFHLEAGQPGTKAPRLALAAAAESLTGEPLGYTEALGRPGLRARIAQHYREAHGITVPAERIVITTGSSAGFILAFIAMFDHGETLAMAVPGYPAYRNVAHATGLVPHFIPCRDDVHFKLTAKTVAEARDIDGLLIASPANPSGTIIDEDELSAIIGLTRERKIRLISDEIYHGISYNVTAQTALAHTNDVIVVNSFSKYYSMTGWRIGWMVVPEEFVRPIERLTQNLYISPPTISQVAATAAMDASTELDGHVRAYAQNRTRLLAAVREAGFGSIAPADGAFYVYANVAPFGMKASELAQRLLDETGVAATPGLDFDPEEGEQWLRLSYAGAPSEIEQAAQALTTWCRALRR